MLQSRSSGIRFRVIFPVSRVSLLLVRAISSFRQDEGERSVVVVVSRLFVFAKVICWRVVGRPPGGGG